MHSSLSASLRKAFRKVTEVNILDEDYRQPVSRNEKSSNEEPDRCGSSSGFLLLRSSHRQSNPPVSTMLDMREPHIQTKRPKTAKIVVQQFRPSPPKVAPQQSRPVPSASNQGPTYPTLRANPFPEVTDLFCRLPLSTLFYQLEAVHLGDLLRL
ncbi:hypothetical protein L7F22_010184 [Adiantum nelumboides]|nr:hypothetical protein [Adiantum nelumboides]